MEVDLELEMKLSRRELRLLLLHEFRLGREATSNICGTMGKAVLSIRTAQHWFHRFKNGNFELDDLSHSGRPFAGGYGSFKGAYRTRSSIDYKVLSRASWMLSYSNRNTSARIRQNVEIRGLDTS